MIFLWYILSLCYDPLQILQETTTGIGWWTSWPAHKPMENWKDMENKDLRMTLDSLACTVRRTLKSRHLLISSLVFFWRSTRMLTCKRSLHVALGRKISWPIHNLYLRLVNNSFLFLLRWALQGVIPLVGRFQWCTSWVSHSRVANFAARSS